MKTYRMLAIGKQNKTGVDRRRGKGKYISVRSHKMSRSEKKKGDGKCSSTKEQQVQAASGRKSFHVFRK